MLFMEIKTSHCRARLTIGYVIAAAAAGWFVREDLLAQTGAPFRIPDLLECVLLQVSDNRGVD